ncbi:hypothetical protein BABINDRAFT_24538, partial [Babjeviella inositovora NRRL Y-12698]
LLMLVPGNPGLTEYYISYLDFIAAKYPQFEIICPSHAGFHTARPLSAPRDKPVFYSLKAQINHKLEILDSMHPGTEPRDLYILGHSVGAYMVQKIVHSLGRSAERPWSVKFVGLITPTIIDIAKSTNGTFASKVFKFLRKICIDPAKLLAFLARVVDMLLPVWLIKFILVRRMKLLSHQDATQSLEATCNIISSPSIVFQAVSLAQEEMARIKHDTKFQEEFFASHTKNGKIWAYFAKNDGWVSDKTRELILDKYSCRDNVVMVVDAGGPNGIEHSFCIKQSDSFARITI